MTPEQFMANFGVIAEAPGGVEKLRSLIPRLGVMGLLRTGSPSDAKALSLLPKLASDLEQRAGKKWKKRKRVPASERSSAVPPRWVRAYLGEILELAYGKGLSKKERMGGKTPVYGSNGIVGYHNRPLVQVACLVVGRKGSAGAVNISSAPCWPIDTTYYVVPASGTILKFLYYLLSTLQLDRLGSSIVPGLNREDAYALTVLLPPLAEQKRIVAKVDQLMAMLDDLEQRQEKKRTVAIHVSKASLDRLVHAEDPDQLARAWERVSRNFGVIAGSSGGIEKLKTVILQLAIHGVLTNPSHSELVDIRDSLRTERKKLEVAQTIASIKRLKPLDERELKPLPEGWCWVRVADAGEVKLGRQRSPKNHFGPNMRPYLRVANVQEAKIDTTDVLEMNFSDEEFERFALRSGDVLLNEGQSYELVGRPALYRGEVPGACFQNTLLRFRPFSPVSSEFALLVFRAYLRNWRFRREVKQTTNMAHLSAGRLAPIEFPVPPLTEQKQIVAKVRQLLSTLDELQKLQEVENTTLRRIAEQACRA